MTVAAGDSGSNAGATSVATSGSINVSVGDVILVVVGVDNGPQTITSISDNASVSNTYTPNGSNPQSVNGQNVYFYRSVITTAKTGLIITANFSASAPACIGAVQVTGRSASPFLAEVAFTEPTAVTNHTSGATGAISAGCDVICLWNDSAFFDSGTAETYTATGAFTLLSAATVTSGATTPTGGCVYINNVGSGSSQSATWTNNPHTTTAASVIWALLPAVGNNATIAWVV